MVKHAQVALLEARITRLEARCGRWALLAAAGVVLAAVALLVGARLPADPVLRAERLLLSDGAGAGFAEIGRIDGAPALVLRDAQGRDRVKHVVGPQGPGVGVLDAERPGWQAWLGASAGMTSLAFYDALGHVRLELRLDEGGPRLEVQDAGGAVVQRLAETGLDSR